MKKVKPAIGFVMKMLGEQSPVLNEPVRFATWCLTASPEGGGELLFNVLTKELIFLDGEESDFLCITDLSDSDLKEIRNNELFRYLYCHWFLVPEEHDDKNLALEVRSVADCMNNAEGILGYTILTTTECNARCFYCYERDMKRIRMSRQVALDTAEYIKRTAGKHIKLHWFGGEPLFNASVIDIITEELRKSGIDFISVITSNGYLADDAIVQRATELWNLKGVQITLDGTEQIYNQRKAYVNCRESAFQRVLANIGKLLSAGIGVVIRMNMDLDNAKDLYRLCDLLADKFAEYDNFKVYAYYIYKEKTALPFEASLEETFKELNKLRAYICELGLNGDSEVSDKVKVSHCMADKDYSIVISPTGELYKCEHVGLTKECGTIYTGVQDQENIEYWKKSPGDGEICDTCPLYPDCVRVAACPDDFEFCPRPVYDEKINKVRNEMLYTYKKVSGGDEEVTDTLFEENC